MCPPYGWVVDPNSLNKDPFWQIFLQLWWVIQKLVKIIKNGLFSTKIHHKSGYDGKFQ